MAYDPDSDEYIYLVGGDGNGGRVCVIRGLPSYRRLKLSPMPVTATVTAEIMDAERQIETYTRRRYRRGERRLEVFVIEGMPDEEVIKLVNF